MRSLLWATALAAASLVAGSAFAASSPDQLVTSALAAGKAQRSVHYVASWVTPGVHGTMVGDAAVDRGIQRVTYRKGTRTGHATVRVVANTAYVRGDAFTLENFVGLSAQNASSYAGRWIQIPPTHAWFRDVAYAVRLASTIDELETPMTKPRKVIGTTTVHGQRVVQIRSQSVLAGQPVATVLYVRADGPPLPVAEFEKRGTAEQLVVLGRWNQPVDVAAPTGAVPAPR
jgi:hypothetical protein